MMKIVLSLVLLATIAEMPLPHDRGVVRGWVKSQDTKELLPRSAIVFIAVADTVPERRIVTRSGVFTIIDMPIGVYRARITCDGFAPFMSPTFRVRADSILGLTFVLHPFDGTRDSAGTVRIGKPGVDYKMRYYNPEPGRYK